MIFSGSDKLLGGPDYFMDCVSGKNHGCISKITQEVVEVGAQFFRLVSARIIVPFDQQ